MAYWAGRKMDLTLACATFQSCDPPSPIVVVFTPEFGPFEEFSGSVRHHSSEPRTTLCDKMLADDSDRGIEMTEAEIFSAALALSPEDRAAFLDRACGDNAALRANVEELLRLNSDTKGFMQRPAVEIAGLEQNVAIPGSQIGPYTLVEQVGEGGFGLVFRATQAEPVQRTVAIKLLKRGMDSEAVLKRFELERQSLAAMNHSGIAQVFDAGISESGQHYFVMEFVEGSSITDFADAQQLAARDRLELFAQVCDAVAHAHQKGILHRDLKPSNVLVTQEEGRSQVKVIDFGIAKSIGAGERSETQITQVPIMMGTPQYMSPEQAASSPVVDTRTDVYAMGVMLYELLTGRLPFEPAALRNAAQNEMLRIIREEDPPKPSTKLSSINEPDQATIARQRSTQPRTLIRELRSELEWIPLKAMRKDPDHRYGGASAMGEDIQNYLAGKALVAGPESSAYRARKFVRRYRWPVAAAGVISSLLIGGIAATSWFYFQAAKEAKRTADVLEVVTNAFEAADPYWGGGDRTTSAKDVLIHASETVGDSELDREGRLEVLKKLTSCFISLGEYESAAPTAKEVEELSRQLLGEEHTETIEAMRLHGKVRRYLGDSAAAVRLLEKVLQLSKSNLGAEDRRTATAMTDLAHAYFNVDRTDEAMPLFKEACRIQDATRGPGDSIALSAKNDLGTAYLELGRLDEAIPLFEQAREDMTRVHGADHPETLAVNHNLANAYEGMSRLDEAIELYEQTLKHSQAKLGDEHPDTLSTMNSLASAYETQGDFEKAIPLSEATWRGLKSELGEDHPYSLSSANNLAFTYRNAGELDKAIELYTSLVDHFRATFGPSHGNTLLLVNNFAETYMRANRFDEAEPLLRECLNTVKADDPEGWAAYSLTSKLGECLLKQGNVEKAEPLLRTGFAGLQRVAGVEPSAPQRQKLADAARRLQNWAEIQGDDETANRWRQNADRFDAEN